MKTVCLKLSSGEELIARQSAELLMEGVEPGFYDLQDIHIINLVPVKEGMAISFIPWAMGAGKKTISVRSSHVTALYEPDLELEKGFLQQISGIQLAGIGGSPSIKM